MNILYKFSVGLLGGFIGGFTSMRVFDLSLSNAIMIFIVVEIFYIFMITIIDAKNE